MSEARSAAAVGLVCTIVSVSLSAGRDLFFAHILHQVSMFSMILIAFGGSMLAFSIPHIIRPRKLLSNARNRRPDLIRINITTAVMWLAFIYALKHIEPAVVVAINSAVIPIATLAFATLNGRNVESADLVSSAGIFLSVALLAIVTITGVSGVGRLSATQAVLGIVGALVSGVTTAWNNIIAKRLAEGGLNASTVMALRFPLLIVSCLACIRLTDTPFAIGTGQLGAILLVALLLIVVPLYFLQLGIARSDVATTAVLIAIGPLITFLCQQALGNYPFSVPSLAGILIATMFVIYAIYEKFRAASELETTIMKVKS
ncbi:EamA family transporter [Nocardia sp. CNY236]|uniref:EamA family transporter n=1 Tax=Nocardia sp. CNY236 TaxID=1169152 RepID=UPI0004023D7B|nr:EamA family transporter [Nocardia sp. CNY236]